MAATATKRVTRVRRGSLAKRKTANPNADRLRRAYLDAYKTAGKADDAFQAALEKVHGKKAAGDKRYRGGHSPAIEALGQAKHRADEKMRTALAAMRAAGVSVNAALPAARVKKNAFWPFDSFTKTTIYHVPSGAKYSKVGAHKGYAIYRDPKADNFLVPSLDRDSRFDTKRDAVRFVDAWSKASRNPVTSIGAGALRADIYALAGGRHQVRMRGQKPQFFPSRDTAMTYARGQVHGRRKNVGPIEVMYADQMIEGKQSLAQKLLNRLQGKQNPEASAAEMYQLFHGLPAEKVVEYRQTEHVHEWLWAVGTLTSLHVSNGKKTVTLSAPDPKKNPFEDVVMVAMTEDGKQVHFRGGDQSLPLDKIAEAFGLTEDDVREHMEIGRVTQMTYQTRKVFEDDGTVNVDFYHDLGKEHAQNRLPLLVYKPLNPSIDLVGGRYKVAPLDRSIGASPGIVG